MGAGIAAPAFKARQTIRLQGGVDKNVAVGVMFAICGKPNDVAWVAKGDDLTATVFKQTGQTQNTGRHLINPINIVPLKKEVRVSL
jgi:hypothetical protein